MLSNISYAQLECDGMKIYKSTNFDEAVKALSKHYGKTPTIEKKDSYLEYSNWKWAEWELEEHKDWNAKASFSKRTLKNDGKESTSFQLSYVISDESAAQEVFNSFKTESVKEYGRETIIKDDNDEGKEYKWQGDGEIIRLLLYYREGFILGSGYFVVMYNVELIK